MNDDAYGFVLNTDGGTFDGVALADAVQASEDVVPSSIGVSLSAARSGRTER